MEYKITKDEEVQSASGTSTIVGQGILRLPIDGGTLVEAYHSPNVSKNIVSVAQLSYTFNVLFKKDHVDHLHHKNAEIRPSGHGFEINRRDIPD